MDGASFDKLSTEAMSSHHKKPEVIQIMRALAMKHADQGDHAKALQYIGRAEKLANELLGGTEEHS